jgi:uroporphyrinogen-III synthase
LSEVLDRLVVGAFDVIVLLTGVGTHRLFEEAERAGRLADTRHAVSHAITVCRGPKPTFALKQHGLTPTHVVAEPHTTAELLDALAIIPLAGRHVLTVSAGERMPEPTAFLLSRGASPVEVQLYRWDLTPRDAARLGDAVRELIRGRIDAAAFTTQVQVRHLFDVAARTGNERRLADALRERVLVGAVGPTCADALRAHGIEPDVVPEHPKMGHLVVALARAIERRGRAQAADLPASVTDYVHAILRGTAMD